MILLEGAGMKALGMIVAGIDKLFGRLVWA
jgi:hypothetical protein